jgi:predicted dehydrogenase
MVGAREKQLLKSVGLVGCGEIAASYLPCLRACGGQVARVFDPDLTRAAAITAPGGAAEGAVRCATLDELLACTDVEIVLNLTPVQHHAEVSRAALLAGKHVWSEKPLAQTQQDARELVALAHQRGLELGCSPLSFWGEAQQTLAHLLRAGALGQVRMAQVDLLCGAHAPADWNNHDALAFNLGGWAQHGRMRVGSMIDVGVYAVALLTALLGPVARVAVVAAKQGARGARGAGGAGRLEHGAEGGEKQIDLYHAPLIDLYHATLIMRSGAVAHVCSSFSLPSTAARKRSLSISGDTGTLTLGDIFNFNTPLSYDGVAAADDGGDIGERRLERGEEGQVRPRGGQVRPRGGAVASGCKLKKGLVYPWRPPYARAASHAHVTDWARGLVLLARSVAANEGASANAPPHAHTLSSGSGERGGAIGAQEVPKAKAEGNRAEGEGDGERPRARAFTGEHAAHIVEVLEAIVSASAGQGQREAAGAPCQPAAGGGRDTPAGAPCQGGGGDIEVKVVEIASCFQPLPMLPLHIVPKQIMAGLARAGAGEGGVHCLQASRIVLGTMVLAQKTCVNDAYALLDAAWALGINWYVWHAVCLGMFGYVCQASHSVT